MGELTGGTMKIEPQHYLACDTKTAALMQFTSTRGDRRLAAMLCGGGVARRQAGRGVGLSHRPVHIRRVLVVNDYSNLYSRR